MQLILARHGNTFSKGEKTFWVGARNDLALSPEGCLQAEHLGNVLAQTVEIDAVYHAPLKRTTQFSEIAISNLHYQPKVFVDSRLIELDYGDWSGLTDEEIKAKAGHEIFSLWNDKCIWPTNCNWSDSPEIIQQQIKDWIGELQDTFPKKSTIFAVTSNGRLRYFLKLINNEFEHRIRERSFKVGTGKVCLLQIESKTIALKLWNAEPESLLTAL